MNTRLLLAVALALGNGGLIAADYTDNAQVISATPIVERVTEPRQECTTDRAAGPQERSVIAPIVGGVAGALLGSTIGRGSGRNVATAAGAVAGTVIGDRVVNPDSNRSATGAIVGGAAGGLLGSQVGRGDGRTAATATGAIAGAVVGDRVDNRQTAAGQPAQRCRTVEMTREVVRGYTVVYRYNGRDITTTMPYDPGQAVRVAVSAIDGMGDNATAPTANMMGGNVREVDTRAAPAPGSPASGNYSYRY